MLLTAALMLLQSALQPTQTPPANANGERVARRAQQRFESVRRMQLPRGHGGSDSDCDANLGRFCYTYDSAETRVAEPRAIVEARVALLHTLDSLAAIDSTNGWIAGQRVRYFVEAQRYEEAIRAARQCSGAANGDDAWWCPAIAGVALHAAERYAAADSAFDVALSAMPRKQRCDWTDVRRLAWPTLARALNKQDCAGREALANAVWPLAQPMWSTPGNDARSEFFARATMAVILADAAEAMGMAWGSDSRELTLRYGWPEWYSRSEDYAYSVFAEPHVTGHDREPSFTMLPDLASAERPLLVGDGDWRPYAAVAPSRYAPRHIHALLVLPHQLVRFPRGDSTLVVLAFAVTDTALARDSVRSTLAVRASETLLPLDDETRGVRIDSSRVTGVMRSTIPNTTATISAEVYGAASRRLARTRYTIDRQPRGAWTLSDLLLFDASDTHFPITTDGAAASALTDGVASTQTPLGVLWELRAPAGASAAWMSIRMEPVRVGMARRLATRLHVASEPTIVRMRWQGARSDTAAQSVSLRLPPDASGRYRVTLSVDEGGQTLASTSREIDLRP
jgi:hypothetical protein